MDPERAAGTAPDVTEHLAAVEPDPIGFVLMRYQGEVDRIVRCQLRFPLRRLCDAEDVTQDVLVALLSQDLTALAATPERLKAYVGETAQHTLIDLVQFYQRSKRCLALETPLEALAGPAKQALTDSAPSPEEVACTEGDWTTFLELLPVAQQRLLKLRRQGYTAHEIAAVIGASVRQVRSQLAHLRKKLDEWWPTTEKQPSGTDRPAAASQGDASLSGEER